MIQALDVASLVVSDPWDPFIDKTATTGEESNTSNSPTGLFQVKILTISSKIYQYIV